MDLQMGLAETMKNIAKGIQTEINNAPFNGVGYVTEKLYMLLQLYIQNKGWNPSVELLQCFTELKEASMLPSASYLQMLASQVTLDSQGRLILRENGKIILPYEHFANAVMLKHMNGPHGLHLNVEATVRAVMDSYTIGREEFGMEKEFIIEVVQNCPNPTCRYYKTQLPASSSSSSASHKSNSNSYINESHSNKASVNSATSNNSASNAGGTVQNRSATPTANTSETPLSLPQPSNAGGSTNNIASTGSSTSLLSLPIDLTNVFEANLRNVMAASGAADLAKLSAVVKGGGGRNSLSITRTSSNDILQQAIRNEANNRRQMEHETRRQLEAETRRLENEARRLENETRRTSVSSNNTGGTGGNSGAGGDTDEMNSVTSHKLSDFLKANLESLDSLNKDLYAAHNGTWGATSTPSDRGESPKARHSSGRTEQDSLAGQEKIVRAFSEIMRNMGRMKTCVRPSMCKPYGKQSETLQKTLVDTIQLVQSLRSFLPPPHIAVSSWKNEDKTGSASNLSSMQVSAASLAAAAAVVNRKPPGSLNSGAMNAMGLGLGSGGVSGQMSLNTAAQIVSGSNLEELVEAVRQQQKSMATGD